MNFTQQARDGLQQFMQKSGKSQNQISKEIGFSPSVISQFLKGTYIGDNTQVAEDINNYLVVSKERLNAIRTETFYPELQNTKDVLFACMHAHTNNDIALVCGDAGAGKTTALMHYLSSNTGVIMVTANACTQSATAVLQLICFELGKKAPGRKAALMQMLVEQLRETNRLIIIDEADHLSLGALQAVRNLNDLAKVGIVLSGNDKIYLQMVSPRKGYEFDQIRTRIIVRKKVQNNYTVQEIQGVFPNVGTSEVGYLLKLACVESLRTAQKIYRIAVEYANTMHKSLNLSILRQTQREFLGVEI